MLGWTQYTIRWWYLERQTYYVCPFLIEFFFFLTLYHFKWLLVYKSRNFTFFNYLARTIRTWNCCFCYHICSRLLHVAHIKPSLTFHDQRYLNTRSIFRLDCPWTENMNVVVVITCALVNLMYGTTYSFCVLYYIFLSKFIMVFPCNICDWCLQWAVVISSHLQVICLDQGVLTFVCAMVTRGVGWEDSYGILVKPHFRNLLESVILFMCADLLHQPPPLTM